MEETLTYLPLFIVFIVAWAVPMILSWFEISKVPTVIVEIILGVIIGPSVLDLLGDTPHLDFLSQTGFLFLIFLSGLALDIDKIISSLPKKIRKVDLVSNSFIVANIIYFGSLLLAWPAAWVVSLFFEIDIFFFTILFPTVALSIIVPILKNDGELNRKFGQIVLMVGAIATIMSIILISIYSGVLQKGFQTELLLFLVIFVVFFASYYVGKQLVKITLFKQIMYTLEHAASQIRIRGSIAVLLFFIVIADIINTEHVLGAFFAGSLLSLFLSKERSALIFKLDGMGYGFFIPIFFIMVGVNLDLSALGDFSSSIPFVVALLAATFITQLIPTYVVTSVFGIKKTTAAGLLLSSRMGLMIATAQIGIALEIITPAANAAIVITAIVSSVLSPFLYKLLNVEGQRQQKLFIIGGNKTAGLLGERLKMHGVDFMIITSNLRSHNLFLDKGLNSIHAEFVGSQMYNELKIKPYHPVVVLTSSETNNTEVVKRFKNDFKHDKIYTIFNPALKELAADSEIQLLDKHETMAAHFESAIVRPDTYQSLGDEFGAYQVEDIKMTNKSMERKQVKDLAWHPSGSLVLLRRAAEMFVPHGDTHLLMGDVITVIGNEEALKDFRVKFRY